MEAWTSYSAIKSSSSAHSRPLIFKKQSRKSVQPSSLEFFHLQNMLLDPLWVGLQPQNLIEEKGEIFQFISWIVVLVGLVRTSGKEVN